MILLNFLFVFCISYILCMIFINNQYLRNIFSDLPNHRSLHSNPTPRSGGVCILITLILFCYTSGLKEHISIFYLITPILILMIFDDIFGINFLYKLVFQVLTILALLIHFEIFNIYYLLFFVFFQLWFVNSINFCDGINGLIGSYLAISNICIIFLSDIDNLILFHSFTLFSILPFLIKNFSKGEIFLGDTGSIGLTLFLISSFVFLNDSIIAFYYLFVFFLPLLVDTTVTILIRLKNKHNIFSAHKEHLYQKIYFSQKSSIKITISMLLISTINMLIFYFLSFLLDYAYNLVLILLSNLLLYAKLRKRYG